MQTTIADRLCRLFWAVPNEENPDAPARIDFGTPNEQAYV